MSTSKRRRWESRAHKKSSKHFRSFINIFFSLLCSPLSSAFIFSHRTQLIKVCSTSLFIYILKHTCRHTPFSCKESAGSRPHTRGSWWDAKKKKLEQREKNLSGENEDCRSLHKLHAHDDDAKRKSCQSQYHIQQWTHTRHRKKKFIQAHNSGGACSLTTDLIVFYLHRFSIASHFTFVVLCLFDFGVVDHTHSEFFFYLISTETRDKVNFFFVRCQFSRPCERDRVDKRSSWKLYISIFIGPVLVSLERSLVAYITGFYEWLNKPDDENHTETAEKRKAQFVHFFFCSCSALSSCSTFFFFWYCYFIRPYSWNEYSNESNPHMLISTATAFPSSANRAAVCD